MYSWYIGTSKSAFRDFDNSYNCLKNESESIVSINLLKTLRFSLDDDDQACIITKKDEDIEYIMYDPSIINNNQINIEQINHRFMVWTLMTKIVTIFPEIIFVHILNMDENKYEIEILEQMQKLKMFKNAYLYKSKSRTLFDYALYMEYMPGNLANLKPSDLHQLVDILLKIIDQVVLFMDKGFFYIQVYESNLKDIFYHCLQSNDDIQFQLSDFDSFVVENDDSNDVDFPNLFSTSYRNACLGCEENVTWKLFILFLLLLSTNDDSGRIMLDINKLSRKETKYLLENSEQFVKKAKLKEIVKSISEHSTLMNNAYVDSIILLSTMQSITGFRSRLEEIQEEFKRQQSSQQMPIIPQKMLTTQSQTPQQPPPQQAQRQTSPPWTYSDDVTEWKRHRHRRQQLALPPPRANRSFNFFI